MGVGCGEFPSSTLVKDLLNYAHVGRKEATFRSNHKFFRIVEQGDAWHNALERGGKDI